MQLTYSEIIRYVLPIFEENEIYSTKIQSNILEVCTDKRRSDLNGKRITIYDFTKIKSLI